MKIFQGDQPFRSHLEIIVSDIYLFLVLPQIVDLGLKIKRAKGRHAPKSWMVKKIQFEH